MRAFFRAPLWEPDPLLLQLLAVRTIWLSIYGLHKMVSSSKKIRQHCNSNFRLSIYLRNSRTAFPISPIGGGEWDLSHLDPFAFRIDLELGSDITVLVLFSCHCFSHSFRWDKRARHAIPAHEVYFDGREHRILNPQRYELSRRFLRDIVSNLSSRRITVANEKMPNFVTIEDVNADGTASLYAIFFEVKKDRSRKGRLVMRIQSAYLLDNGLTSRQVKGGKIAFETLLRATHLGKRIRG